MTLPSTSPFLSFLPVGHCLPFHIDLPPASLFLPSSPLSTHHASNARPSTFSVSTWTHSFPSLHRNLPASHLSASLSPCGFLMFGMNHARRIASCFPHGSLSLCSLFSLAFFPFFFCDLFPCSFMYIDTSLHLTIQHESSILSLIDTVHIIFKVSVCCFLSFGGHLGRWCAQSNNYSTDRKSVV